MSAQKRLYDIVNTDDYVSFPDDAFQTGVTMTDPDNGQVLAQIGGRKTGDVRLAYNRAAQNTRSNGSTMKPLMDYGPAIEYLNYSTYEQMTDEPYKYPGTTISLYDWDKKYQGRISMRTALEQSRNIPAVKTLSAVGMTNAVKFLKGLGIDLPASEQYLSSAIGASVNTVEEAGAYGAFANGGTYYKPYYVNKVVSADGNTQTFNSQGTRAMKSSTAYMITDMLKGVLTKGTGTSAAISGLYQAGKTGTTDYSDEELKQNPALNATGIAKDAWFTGYTRNRVISVWTGYDKPTSHGISYAEQTVSQKIYKALMSYTSQNLDNKDWTKPDTVESYNILKAAIPAQRLRVAQPTPRRSCTFVVMGQAVIKQWPNHHPLPVPALNPVPQKNPAQKVPMLFPLALRHLLHLPMFLLLPLVLQHLQKKNRAPAVNLLHLLAVLVVINKIYSRGLTIKNFP